MDMRRFLLAGAILFFVSLVVVSGQNAPVSIETEPSKVELPVPFIVQAITGQWAFPWEDFCEEATVVMATSYVRGIEMRPLVAALQMLRVAEFEQKIFNYDKDTGVADTERILREFYGVMSTKIVENPTADSIKDEVRAGSIVIVPVAGKLLYNPYFANGGPRYHMLLVKGFDETTGEFIVNEPGTRYGNGFRYREAVIMNAMHDFVPISQGAITSGAKRVLVISKS